MTIGAINAFLKTCEEPLPNRIIIATSVNKSQILDTVISRSISLNFSNDDINPEHDFTADLAAVTKVVSTDINIYKKHQALSEINKK
jgi:DNA polymerase III gamma/tau subunit